MKKLLKKEQILSRIKELGKQISDDYKDEKIILLGSLKGAVLFYGDLAKEITSPVEFEFIQVASYYNDTEPSEIEFVYRSKQSFNGEHVLIIEDIVDTGNTIDFLIRYINQFNPKSVKVCSLLNKPSRREKEVQVDYCGFEIPNEFVIGYGLDYAQKYRNFSFIGILEQE